MLSYHFFLTASNIVLPYLILFDCVVFDGKCPFKIPLFCVATVIAKSPTVEKITMPANENNAKNYTRSE